MANAISWWNSNCLLWICSKCSVILRCMFTPRAVYCYLNKALIFMFVSVLYMQNLKTEVEELIFCHYVVCNDTQETLCFGQVDTDESVVLSSGQSHQYSWRSHKSPQVTVSCWHLHLAVFFLFGWMHALLEQHLRFVLLATNRTVMQIYVQIHKSISTESWFWHT